MFLKVMANSYRAPFSKWPPRAIYKNVDFSGFISVAYKKIKYISCSFSYIL